MVLSNECCSLNGATIEYRTILGSIAFSRVCSNSKGTYFHVQGVHYWEVTVDKYDTNADIVLGVAQPAVNRNVMLGKFRSI